MRTAFAAALLMAAASLTTMAFAQVKPMAKPMPSAIIAAEPVTNVAPAAPLPETATDARSMASDQDVADARRAYRAACSAHESASFCDCVTAGVAQALLPAEVRIAARTIGERINAQGDAALGADTDITTGAESSAERIAQVEGHYANACAPYRG